MAEYSQTKAIKRHGVGWAVLPLLLCVCVCVCVCMCVCVCVWCDGRYYHRGFSEGTPPSFCVCVCVCVVMGGTTPEDSHRDLLPTQVSLVVPPRCTESIRQSGAFLNATRGYESQTVLSYRGVRTRRLTRQIGR